MWNLAKSVVVPVLCLLAIGSFFTMRQPVVKAVETKQVPDKSAMIIVPFKQAKETQPVVGEPNAVVAPLRQEPSVGSSVAFVPLTTKEEPGLSVDELVASIPSVDELEAPLSEEPLPLFASAVPMPLIGMNLVHFVPYQGGQKLPSVSINGKGTELVTMVEDVDGRQVPILLMEEGMEQVALVDDGYGGQVPVLRTQALTPEQTELVQTADGQMLPRIFAETPVEQSPPQEPEVVVTEGEGSVLAETFPQEQHQEGNTSNAVAEAPEEIEDSQEVLLVKSTDSPPVESRTNQPETTLPPSGNCNSSTHPFAILLLLLYPLFRPHRKSDAKRRRYLY